METVSSADGTRIGFRRDGSGEATVLFVHGTMATADAWALVGRYLSDRYRVVAMDRRGHGISEAGPAHSIGREADDVLAVIDAVGEPVHLVGHSAGARVALAAAARTDRLLSLTLYEPPIAVSHVPDDFIARAEALISAGDRDSAVRGFLTEAAAAADDEIAIMADIPSVWDGAKANVQNGPRDLRALAAEPVDLDSLRAITVPVLILVGGDQDAPVYLDGLTEIERALPRARREVLAGQRHFATAFDADTFAAKLSAFFAALP